MKKLKNKFDKGHLFHHLDEFQIGFEIFNMFDVQNSITNTWVRDVYTKQQYAVPNFLTPRIFRSIPNDHLSPSPPSAHATDE